MKPAFADTSFWIGLINPGDKHHEFARSYLKLNPTRLILTTEWVVGETLNYFSAWGANHRRAAVELILHMERAEMIVIIGGSSDSFRLALDYYARRLDKEWSFTDCHSFLIMDNEGLTEALTHDLHFRQAGYRPLMREL